MADQRISELTAMTTPTDDDVLAVVDSTTTKKLSWANVKATLKTYLDTLYQPLATVLTNTTASFTTEQQTKLAGIEALAAVTDATNVDNAGATMNTDTDVSGNNWVLDEDNMASDSATKVPTQQSVKAYVDTELATIDALPDQTGNSGKFLKTDGEDPSWEALTGGGDMLSTNNLSDVVSASTARTNLGLTIGTNVQAQNATLQTIATNSSADAVVSDASTTVKGKVELATTAETDTGTSTTTAITPDALAGSNFGKRTGTVFLNSTTELTTDNKAYFRIPASLNGMNLVAVSASVGTGASGSSSSGTPTFTIKNVTDNQQMLSTSLTVDATEYTSATATTPAVINTTYDDVATDDLLEVACTTAGTGVTYASVSLTFQLP